MLHMDQSNAPIFLPRTPPSTSTLPPDPSRSASSPPSPFPSLARSLGDSSTWKPFLPRKAIGNSPDHEKNLQHLLTFQKHFQRRIFWDECAILERIYYKNKSQHRRAGYFQRLCECRRLVSRIKELDIAGLMDELVKKFYSGRSLKVIAETSDRWDSIPHRSTIAFTSTRIIGAILLHQKIQSTLHEAYGAFYQLMSKTQFMPLALIAIGLCSRLSVMSKAWTTELVDCYELLVPWMRLFPQEEIAQGMEDYEKQLPETLESVIATNVPTIPESTEMPVSLESLQSTSEGSLDLGEVIQRAQPALASSSESEQASLDATTCKRSSSLSPTNEPDQDSTQHSSDIDERHTSLLSEINAIFQTEPSSVPNAKPKKSKLETSLHGSSQTTGEGKKQKMKDNTIQQTKDSPSPFSGQPKSKSSSKFANNFDDVFNSSRQLSKGSKREIDDIFGRVKKPKQKSTGSEIDQIFGLPKKKKKTP
ncbi:hypothetical protein B0O80DRAFT_500550 [Mortierella sp. GBAus27b]|nr:hypothetical protein BGX31_004162 [Mortierella sp. GBA43]KAI8350752.1 hypothetical protein B0O80DRAFT_500550 [Mortierella sp. GBAus27b]